MRDLIVVLENRFEDNHRRAHSLLQAVGDEMLFAKPAPFAGSFTPASPGEHIVRSAAVVEQALGGLTTRLWDDPFEWTLPEELSTVERVAAYLDEVRAYRVKGFAFLGADDDLRREIPAPEMQRPILDVLLEAICRSSEHLGRAGGLMLVLGPNTPRTADR